MRPLRFLLNPVGSAGDVHPFLALGQELLARGHRVTILTNPVFRETSLALGLKFAPIGSPRQLHLVGTDPRIHQPKQAWKVALRWGALDLLHETYDKLLMRHLPGQTVVVGAALSFAARIFSERHQVPMATCLIDPDKLRGLDHSPKLPPMWLPNALPRALKQLQFAIADRWFIDPVVAGETNRFRQQLGLPPVKRLLDRWWINSDLVIGFFDEWFAPRSRDWLPQVHLVGPTLWDPPTQTESSSGVDDFLRQGAAPVLFVPGSAGADAANVMQLGAQVCRDLGVRGILLHKQTKFVPAELPAGVKHFEFVPLRQLLPACAAIVHHGGTGTALQALAAGVPQLICPRSFNHPDIAARIERLGVGRTLSPARFTRPRLAAVLNELLKSTAIKERSLHFSKLTSRNAIAESCDLLESLIPAKDRCRSRVPTDSLADSIVRGGAPTLLDIPSQGKMPS